MPVARAEARAAAVQLIYEAMLGGEGGEKTLSDLAGFSPSQDDRMYLDDVVKGVEAKQAALDGQIEKHLVNWSIERLARVDLAILRLAAYEIFYREDIPSAVAVNEAVELSHIYSTEEAGGFINGVLGSLVRAGVAP